MYYVNRTLVVLLLVCSSIFHLAAQSLETGPASVFEETRQGRRTALGYVYDSGQMTCAHKFHPSGTYLRVTRIDNGQSVVVQVIDRLSARSDAVVVLSNAAARLLNIVPDRVAIVEIEPLGANPDQAQVYYNTSPRALQPSGNLTARGAAVPRAYDAISPPPAPTSTSQTGVSGSAMFNPKPASPASTYQAPVNQSPSLTARGGDIPRAYDAPAASPATRAYSAPTTQDRYYVQTAAFANYDNAQRYSQRLLRQGIQNINIIQAQKADGTTIYRERIGPYPTAAAAKAQKAYLARAFGVTGLVVKGN